MTIRTSTKVVSARNLGDHVEVVVEGKDGKQQTLTADVALNAIGVQGNIENIGLEDVGVVVERGWIKVDQYMRTNVEGIYAIGDVAGPPGLRIKRRQRGYSVSKRLRGLRYIRLITPTFLDVPTVNRRLQALALRRRKRARLAIRSRLGNSPLPPVAKLGALAKQKASLS